MAEKKAAAAAVEEFGWDDMREIILPRAGRNERKTVYVNINGHEFNIPRGEKVSVPYPVYERLEIMLEAEARADATAEGIPNKV